MLEERLQRHGELINSGITLGFITLSSSELMFSFIYCTNNYGKVYLISQGGPLKIFTHPKGGSEKIVGLGGGLRKFLYFKTNT